LSDREHIIAVIDPTRDTEPTLEIARETVRRGGKATLVLLLGADDRRTMQALAEGARLSLGQAEEIYIDRATSALLRSVGGAGTTAIVRYRPSTARDLLATAERLRATSLSVPASLVRQRQWRSALSNMPLPVYVTPARRAA
jgi:hypothetical protein